MVRSVARVCTHMHYRFRRGARRPTPCGKPVDRTTNWRSDSERLGEAVLART